MVHRADGAVHPQTWVGISWSPGADAASHDVYFNDNFDDVNAGTESAFQGNQADTFLTLGFPGFAYPAGFVVDKFYFSNLTYTFSILFSQNFPNKIIW